MHLRSIACVAMTALGLLAVGVQPTHAADPKKRAAPETVSTAQQTRNAVERGLAFLEKDAVKWRKERKCATCHHGTMTVWALSEAKSQGYAVAAESLADVVKCTKERLKDIDKPRDPRPGWKMVSTPAVYLSVMAQAVPRQEAAQAAALRLLVKVRAGESAKSVQPDIDAFLARQNADGGWGQLKELRSDAYATGQALYVLSLAGVKHDRVQVRKGMAFLTASQKEDGSWPMTSRAHPGAKPAANPVPITYFGSAWATLALMRSAPK
jgi:hypothetical protein